MDRYIEGGQNLLECGKTDCLLFMFNIKDDRFPHTRHIGKRFSTQSALLPVKPDDFRDWPIHTVVFNRPYGKKELFNEYYSCSFSISSHFFRYKGKFALNPARKLAKSYFDTKINRYGGKNNPLSRSEPPFSFCGRPSGICPERGRGIERAM